MQVARFSVQILACFVFGLATAPAQGASHLWRINEIFSSADGTIQFIELKECCGAPDETALTGLWISSFTNSNSYFFTSDLPAGSTANKYLLMATPGFAALPGAPTPDYIITDNFFSTVEDALSYFFFPAAELSFGPGALPLDGLSSLHQDGSVALNSPTNFQDVTGSVSVGCEFIRGDTNFDLSINVADVVYLLAFLFNDGYSPAPAVAGDVNDDDQTNIADSVYLLSHLFSGGPPPPPPYPDLACE
ncbi:MAG: hypothetical protein ACKVX7_05460 [Planctomycetota bacterium]